MRKIILIVHTSLDGFAAGENGTLSWFEPGAENLDFVCDLTEGADTALFGRASFELLNEYWPHAINLINASKGEKRYSTWYNCAKKIVVSATMPDNQNALVIRDNVLAEVEELKQQAGGNILIFGSPMLAQTLIAANLIDSYWVFINPIIFGQGIPLFAPLPERIKLKLVDTKPFPNGEFALHFTN